MWYLQYSSKINVIFIQSQFKFKWSIYDEIPQLFLIVVVQVEQTVRVLVASHQLKKAFLVKLAALLQMQQRWHGTATVRDYVHGMLALQNDLSERSVTGKGGVFHDAASSHLCYYLLRRNSVTTVPSLCVSHSRTRLNTWSKRDLMSWLRERYK